MSQPNTRRTMATPVFRSQSGTARAAGSRKSERSAMLQSRHMTIGPFIDDEFEARLREAFSTSPLHSRVMLKGRDRELERAVFGLASHGKATFVVGDRGVGKTSLAQTCAITLTNGERRPIFELSCDKGQELFRIIREMSRALVEYDPFANPAQTSLSFKVGPIGYDRKVQPAVAVPLPDSINDAIQILGSALERWRSASGFEVPVVIIDEFDRLEKDKELFGDFIKQVGDRAVAIRLVFCGVAHELSELLGSHPSAPRHITTVLLDRLGWDPRMQIVQDAAKLLDVEFQRDHIFRMAAISDGYPYYIHLIGTEAVRVHHYSQASGRNTISSDEFNEAVARSVENTMLDLKRLYDDATKKYTSSDEAVATVSENELVLWAAASHPDLERSGTAIFQDYVRLKQILQRQGRANSEASETSEKEHRRLFNNRLQALKRNTHGEVLKSEKRGWYYFEQPMLRGYCRLVAHRKTGIELGREYS
jgi:hypothetical protein